MSEPQPAAFSEADEQLFQKVRNKILGKSENEGLATAPGAPEGPAAPAQRQRLWWLVVILAVLGALTSILGWLAPEAYGPAKWVGLIVLGVIGVGLLLGWLKRKAATTRAQLTPGAPAPAAARWRTLLLSFVWFIGLGVLLFPPIELAWLIGVLVLHELGHYLGMLYFGYRDLQMFFIPLLGAAVKGEKRGVPAWQEGIVLLLGPLPGLILGCAIYFRDLAVPVPFLRTGAALLVALNFLNLLPFEPLDGGKFCNRLLFSRFRWLEAVTVVLATVGLVFVCFGPGWICLALSGAFALFVLAPARFKTATAAAALQSRWPDLPPEPANLSEEQWRDLFTITRGQFKSNTPMLADQMKMVHARALLRAESGGATLGLFAVYLAAILLGIVTASVTRLGEDTGRWPIRIKQHVTGTADQAPSPGQ
jgi:Zn-dependent protease